MSFHYQDELMDIARSSYADMLLDDERNRAYYLAIRISVKALVSSVEHNPNKDRFFNCCDIGTGSGLLSMMIVSSFQELKYERFHVTAFECFKPMARCATSVIEANGYDKFITVLDQRSESHDKASFDLLVAELLDTELIGEGCLSTYRYAVQYLCSPTCLFVPHQARIYVQPVASSYLFKRHALDDIQCIDKDGVKRIQIPIPDEVKNCCGLAEMDDLQASALREGLDFHKLAAPELAFDITFNDLSSLKDDDYRELAFAVTRDADQPPVLVVWWDIVMYDRVLTNNRSSSAADDIGSSIEVLSCAPKWARPDSMLRRDRQIKEMYGREVWREHWIQAVYYFNEVPKTRSLVGSLKKGDTLRVHAFHDSRSLWFSLDLFDGLPPNCHCGVHRSHSRTQLAFINDLKMMQPLLESTVKNTTCADRKPAKGSIMFTSRPAEPEMIPIEAAPKWKIQMRPGATVMLEDLSLSDEVPWEKVLCRFRSNISIRPVEQFTIKFAQVRFNNLNRIATKVGQCEGFDVSHLDEMISSSSRAVDKSVHSHSLWEYETYRCEFNNHTVFSSTWDSPENRKKLVEGTYWRPFKLPVAQGFGDWKKGWALVFWAEFTLEKTGQVISTGDLSNSLDRSKPMEWNRSCKQLVYFMHDHPTPPFSNVSVDLSVGIHYSEPQVQRGIDYKQPPSLSSPSKLKRVV